MLTQDKLKRIRLIELKTRKLVQSAFAGAYHTAFKGQGIAFESIRLYEPGDDIRDIDWNATARMGRPYIKQYTEERELTVMLVIDASSSFLFGTVNRQKREVAAELGAVLALSAISNNDKVGMASFSDQLERYVPPRKGRRHVLRMIRELLTLEAEHSGTDMVLALQSVNRALKRQAIVFVISDFFVDHRAIEPELISLNNKHDVIAVVTHDPLERQFEDIGLVLLEDAETGHSRHVDTGQLGWLDQYQQNEATFQKSLDDILRRAKVDRIDITAEGDYLPSLTGFFERRARRIQR